MDMKIESGVFHIVKVGKCKMGKRNSMDIHRNKSAQCVKSSRWPGANKVYLLNFFRHLIEICTYRILWL